MPTPSRSKGKPAQWQTLGNGAAVDAAAPRSKRHKLEPAKVRPLGVLLSSSHESWGAQALGLPSADKTFVLVRKMHFLLGLAQCKEDLPVQSVKG